MAFVAIVAGYLVLRLQDVLPLNPERRSAQSPDLAFNTSVSFETNTNWQNYSGETGVSYLSQMAMLAVRNFTSAATGLAIAIALIRGLTRRSARPSATTGSTWSAATLYILLPISVVVRDRAHLAGRAPDLGRATRPSRTLEGGTQTIALGPIARQEIIKELGNNGGGFLNANSAHPFENPTPLTNMLEMFAMLADPVRAHLHLRALGRRTSARAGRSSRAMAIVFVDRRRRRHAPRDAGNPLFPAGVDQALGQHGGQGRPLRRRPRRPVLGGVTTSTSTGAINAWHDSFQPLAGLVPLFNIELGEITPGGIGAGLYGMLVIGAILRSSSPA